MDIEAVDFDWGGGERSFCHVFQGRHHAARAFERDIFDRGGVVQLDFRAGRASKTIKPDTFAANKKFMMKNFHFTALIFVLFFNGACNNNPSVPQDDWLNDPVFVNADVNIDSCKAIMPRLLRFADSLSSTNEFESLKARNNYVITAENLARLEQLIDSARTNPDRIKNTRNYKIMVHTQSAYLNALISSGEAILQNRSQSFGKWVRGPDSAKNPAVQSGK